MTYAKLLTTAAVLALLAGPVHAGNNNGPKANASVKQLIVNSTSAKASAKAAGVGIGAGGSASVKTERSAPSFGLGGLASGPCTGISGGVTVSMPMGGGGVFGAAEDEECTKRETARVLFSLGMTEEAMAVARTFGPLKALREQQAAAKQPVTLVSKTPATQKTGGSSDLGCEINRDLAISMGVAC